MSQTLFLNYDMKILIMMQKAPGFLGHFNWTCGQGKHEFTFMVKHCNYPTAYNKIQKHVPDRAENENILDKKNTSASEAAMTGLSCEPVVM